MVKSYLSYKPQAIFGVIASPVSNAVLDSTQNFAISASLEQVLVWNITTSELVLNLY